MLKVFEDMLEEIVPIALQKGVRFGSIQIVDSVHSVANVNTAKDKKRQNKGKGRMTQTPDGVSNTNAGSRTKQASKLNKPNTSSVAKPMSA
jgi:hypothetical protein